MRRAAPPSARPRKRAIHYTAQSFLPFAENWIHSQIKNLASWDPIVYCARRENAELFPVGRIREFDFSKRSLSSFVNRAGFRLTGVAPAMAAAMAQDEPSLIHAHFGPSGWAALGLKRRFSIPLVTTFYGYDLTQLPRQNPVWRERYRRLFEAGDLFLVEGRHMRRRLVDLGCPAEKAVVQHLGVDLAAIPHRPRELDGSGEVKILVAATFTEKKGIPDAVEAVGRLKLRRPSRTISLTIIGDARGFPADAEEKKKILEAIARVGPGVRVRLQGFRTPAELRRELYEHHLFLAPSVTARDGNTEGGAPVAIIEASASGMPVVATTHCDIPEVVVDGASGFLAPERDPAALAEKLLFVLDNAPRWPEFGRAGRRHIEDEYDAAKLGPRLEEAYDEIS
ncbi:MAG: glycosyltransferase [Elusimicrobia bacterium]|nr:glycosyltransferase [Elusimicrobiota bacterium]